MTCYFPVSWNNRTQEKDGTWQLIKDEEKLSIITNIDNEIFYDTFIVKKIETPYMELISNNLHMKCAKVLSY